MVLRAIGFSTVVVYYILKMLYPSKFSSLNQNQFHSFSLATLLMYYSCTTLVDMEALILVLLLLQTLVLSRPPKWGGGGKHVSAVFSSF